MWTRLGNIIINLYNKTKRIFSNKEARKELLMDVAVIAPYIATDALLYYVSFLNFLSHLAADPNHPEEESWYFPAYATGTAVISAIMAPALFLLFLILREECYKSKIMNIDN